MMVCGTGILFLEDLGAICMLLFYNKLLNLRSKNVQIHKARISLALKIHVLAEPQIAVDLQLTSL